MEGLSMIERQDWFALVIALTMLLIPLIVFYTYASSIKRGIPIHWGLYGPDRFISAEQFPYAVLLLVCTVFLLWGIRFVFPLHQNIERFKHAYNGFVVLFSLLMALLLSASVQWAAGASITLDTVVYVVVGTMLIAAGAIMYASKRNWAVGFRNPWTLSSDRVWETVNKEAGVYTVFIGILFIIFSFMAPYAAIYLFLALLCGYAVFTLHSYILWRREQ